MNKPSGKKPKPNPAPPSKHILTNLEERIYDLEAKVATLVQEYDKQHLPAPVRNTSIGNCTGITVTREEMNLIVNALVHYWKYAGVDADMRQEQAEWIELTINRFDKLFKEWA